MFSPIFHFHFFRLALLLVTSVSINTAVQPSTENNARAKIDSPADGVHTTLEVLYGPPTAPQNLFAMVLTAMDDDGPPENIHGTKRPRRDTSASDGLSTEAAVLTSEGGEAPADAGEDPPQPRDAQLPSQQQSGRGGRAGGRKRDGRSFSNDIRAYRRAHKKNSRVIDLQLQLYTIRRERAMGV